MAWLNRIRLVCALAGAALAGCGSPAAAPPAAPHMIASYQSGLGGQMALWVAKDGGIFDRNAVDVELKLIQGSAATAAIQNGETQVALVGGSESVNFAASGGDVVIIGVMEPVYPYKFEVAPNIKTVEDLRGRKVSFGGGGGSSNTATRIVLQKLGLNPDKDVVVAHENGGVPARLAAMQHGDIEAALITPPDTVEIEAAGFHPLLDATQLGLVSASEAMLVKRTWLTANREAAQHFADAVVQGIAELKRNERAGMDAIAKYQKIQNERKLRVGYEFFAHEVITQVPEPKPELFETVVREVSANHPEAQRVSLDKLLDPSLMKAAAQKGG